MSYYLSKKLKFFSFWLIIVVILLHSITIESGEANKSIFNFIEFFISGKLTQIAVPLFFIISGYLFFCKIYNGYTFSLYKVKLRKRISTIFIPYILWCSFWYFIIFLLQILPFTSSFFDEPLISLSFKENVLNLFFYPLNYPLWFLRELILYIIISPIIYILIVRFNLLIFLFLLILTFYDDSLFNYEIKILHSYPLLFYVIGCYIGIKKINIECNVKLSIVLFLFFTWFFLNLILLFGQINPNLIFIDQLLFIIKFIGVIALWFLYDKIPIIRDGSPLKIYGLSFFVFAFHGIPIVMLKKLVATLYIDSEFLGFIIYLFIFFFGALISIFAGISLKAFFPKTYSLLTGNR